jgi:hypothetical protein
VEATDLSAVIARIAATRSAKQRPRGAGSGGGPDAPPRLEEWAASSTTSSTDTASSGSSGGSSGGTGLPAIAQEAMPLAWKALASAAGKLVDEVYRPVAFVENTESDTQVWLAHGVAVLCWQCVYVSVPRRRRAAHARSIRVFCSQAACGLLLHVTGRCAGVGLRVRGAS